MLAAIVVSLCRSSRLESSFSGNWDMSTTKPSRLIDKLLGPRLEIIDLWLLGGSFSVKASFNLLKVPLFLRRTSKMSRTASPIKTSFFNELRLNTLRDI